jgi:DNA-binding IclR family transcriptional regulator
VAKIENVIVSMLESTSEGLTLSELSDKAGETEKKVYKALRKLFEQGTISCLNRRYRLSKSENRA